VVRLVAVAAFGALVWASGSAAAGADCVGPTLTVAPTRTAPGDTVEIRGVAFGTDCNDTGRPGPVLGEPMHGVELYAAQGDDVVLVARVDANADYRFSVRVTVPPTFTAGPAGVRLTRDPQPGTFTTFEVRAPTQPVSETTAPPTASPGPSLGFDTVDEPSQSAVPGWFFAGIFGVLVVAGVAAAWKASRSRD
jgi:hypothetical protein